MIRILGPGLVGMVMLAIWVFCVFDVIASESMLVRNLPKQVWLIIVIFVPTVGAVAWLALGRPLHAGWRPGDTSARPVRRALGPEDDPGFGAGSTPSRPDEDRLRRWEADLERREREMRRQQDGDGGGDGGEHPFPFQW